MKILQISAPKTGSFWLNTILNKVLTKKDIPVDSFIRQQPEYEELRKLELSFEGQAGVDMVDIQDDGVFFRVSSILKKPVKDLKDYSEKSTQAWTHSTFCQNTARVFQLYDKKVCIIRDPRDRALSSAKFAFTEYMQKFRPTSYSSPEDFLAHEYERLLEQWVWFYGNYLLHRHELDIHFVFYERLLEDFASEFDALLNYLQLDLNPAEKAEIEEEVTFSSMKADSPRHLQKGRSRKWITQLNAAQQQKAVDIAGPLMDILNYPLTPDDKDLPALPNNNRQKELKNLLLKVDWRGLF